LSGKKEKNTMADIHNFWTLPPDEQETIRQAYPCYSEEEHQAFLNALFPAYDTFSEADQVLDLSDTHNGELPL
jgi:hypothetical protein